jgi:hypothetical protein
MHHTHAVCPECCNVLWRQLGPVGDPIPLTHETHTLSHPERGLTLSARTGDRVEVRVQMSSTTDRYLVEGSMERATIIDDRSGRARRPSQSSIRSAVEGLGGSRKSHLLRFEQTRKINPLPSQSFTERTFKPGSTTPYVHESDSHAFGHLNDRRDEVLTGRVQILESCDGRAATLDGECNGNLGPDSHVMSGHSRPRAVVNIQPVKETSWGMHPT